MQSDHCEQHEALVDVGAMSVPQARRNQQGESQEPKERDSHHFLAAFRSLAASTQCESVQFTPALTCRQLPHLVQVLHASRSSVISE